MADLPSESKIVVPTTKRGGATASPMHVLQMLLATAGLVASSVFLILHQWVIGFILLLICIPLCMINTQK